MSEEENGFCISCGAILPSGAEFCPVCGHHIGGPVMSGGSVPLSKSTAENAGGLITWAVLLMAIYAVLSVSIGLYSILEAGMMVDVLKEVLVDSGIDWVQFRASMGFVSDAEFVSFIVNSGAVSLASGAVIVVSCVLCALRRMYKIAVVLCVAGSAVLFATAAVGPAAQIAGSLATSSVMFIVGALVAYLIYKSEAAFKD
jgi:hypothetical protein